MNASLQPPVPEPAAPEELEVAIVGAGFGGLCMAIRLLAQGERRFAVLEKGAEVGGTWRDNSYPGAECDVQSHLYSYSFAGKPDWSQRYAGWQEIQQYILDTTERFGVRPYVRFGQQVTGLHFDPDTARWRVIMASGLELRARHVVLATGPLHRPNLPRLPGLERFAGKVFHSAQWDHDYDLAGKRIASIGTGGSAIQYCPRIAPSVAKHSSGVAGRASFAPDFAMNFVSFNWSSPRIRTNTGLLSARYTSVLICCSAATL